MGDESDKTNGQRKSIREHLGLVITLFPVVAVALRLARVSELDPTVLSTLIQSGNLVPLILGSVLQGLPAVLLYAVYIFVLMRRYRIDAGNIPEQRLLTWVTSLLSLLFLALLSPAAIGLGAAIVVFGLIITRKTKQERAQRWRERRRAEQGMFEDQFRSASVILILTTLLSGSLWLPTQIVTYGDKQVVAYVLEDNDRFTTLVLDSDREIITVRTADITMEQPCTGKRSIWWRPLLSIFNEKHIHAKRCSEGKPKRIPGPPTLPTVVPSIVQPTSEPASGAPSPNAP